jgi:hypothetical protein
MANRETPTQEYKGGIKVDENWNTLAADVDKRTKAKKWLLKTLNQSYRITKWTATIVDETWELPYVI